jgi:hypothetical protein
MHSTCTRRARRGQDVNMTAVASSLIGRVLGCYPGRFWSESREASVEDEEEDFTLECDCYYHARQALRAKLKHFINKFNNWWLHPKLWSDYL